MQITESLPIDTVLDSGKRKYTIKSVLGQGGFGITYLATSTIYVDNIPFETQFAIKEHYISSMNERQGASVSVSNANNTEEIKESIESFLVEAQRLNKLSLNHSGLVRVNESFRANGTAYYVMEYIKGQSLREYVKHSPQGRLSEDEALKLFRPIAETIGYLHENKVTHLDIKPDNVLLRENGVPVVIDFGLSKHYSNKGTPTSTIKAAGCSAGYSPMEQYVGITTFTPEADIYALSATLLYMFTGKDPRIATEIQPDYVANVLSGIASLSIISSISHAMAKLLEERTHSVSAFIMDLVGQPVNQRYENVHSQNDADANKTKKKKTRKIRQRNGRTFTNQIVFYFATFTTIILLSIIIFAIPRSYNFYVDSRQDDLSSEVVAKSFDVLEEGEHNSPQDFIPKDFVLVPGGHFSYKGNYYERYKIHDVNIDSFFICKFELTQGEYKRVMGKLEKSNCSWFLDKFNSQKIGSKYIVVTGDSFPVRGTYKEFAEYCNARSKEEGYDGFYEIIGNSIKIDINGNGYRMVTPYEWIYAAYGGNLNVIEKFLGGNTLNDVAWHQGNSKGTPHKVGLKNPNVIGLYDIQGNVTEILQGNEKWKYFFSMWGDFSISNWQYNQAYNPTYMVWSNDLNILSTWTYGTRILLIPKMFKNKNLALQYDISGFI